MYSTGNYLYPLLSQSFTIFVFTLDKYIVREYHLYGAALSNFIVWVICFIIIVIILKREFISSKKNENSENN